MVWCKSCRVGVSQKPRVQLLFVVIGAALPSSSSHVSATPSDLAIFGVFLTSSTKTAEVP